VKEVGLLKKVVIREKPLHIEHTLTPRGKSVILVFQQLEGLIEALAVR
jgi:DNA-binding HxlR family transcriptional regulator